MTAPYRPPPVQRIIDSRGPGHVQLPGGYTLCFEYDPDGQAWPIIADDRLDLAPLEDLAAIAPHERLGPLPRRYAAHEPTWRCGAPASTTGRPCKAQVPGPGQRCWHHREREPAQLQLPVGPGQAPS